MPCPANICGGMLIPHNFKYKSLPIVVDQLITRVEIATLAWGMSQLANRG